MGNMPAKLSGKYQSYDINTPYQFTPPMPQSRRNTNPTVSVSLTGSTEDMHHHEQLSADLKPKKFDSLNNGSNGSDSDTQENCINTEEANIKKSLKNMSEISALSNKSNVEEDG